MRNWDIVKGMRFCRGSDIMSEHLALGEDDHLLLLSGTHWRKFCDLNIKRKTLIEALIKTPLHETVIDRPYDNNDANALLIITPGGKPKDTESMLNWLKLSVRQFAQHGYMAEREGHHVPWFVGHRNITHWGDVVGNLCDAAKGDVEIMKRNSTAILKRSW